MGSDKKCHVCNCPLFRYGAFAAAAAVGVTLLLRYRSSKSSTATVEISAENQALLFIKPHGQVDGMNVFVEQELRAAGLKILKSGTLPGAYIDEKGTIDAHYSAIGLYAMKMQPKDLPITEAKKKEFFAKYNVNFDDAAADGSMLNTAQAMEKFSLDNVQMGDAFQAAKDTSGSFKIAPGCYVAYLADKKTFVVNGFYATMRLEYVAKSAVVTWYVVSWPEAAVSWADFRGKVLGATDPTQADPASIRSKILQNYVTMNVPFVPNTGKNCIHGSASPLEAFNERRIWVGATTTSDSFGAQLLSAGVTSQQIDWMCSNPTVDGKPLFDIVEDTNTTECLAKLVEIAKRN